MRILLASILLAGCAASSAQPAQPQPAPSSAPQGELEHGMRNCPSAVAGATTRLTNTPVGIDVEITAFDKATGRQIIELARLHGHMGDPDGAAMEHTGLHGGPGNAGHCPIIHAATNVTFTPLTNGAVIHIQAIVPEDVPALQAMVAERTARLAAR